MNLDQAECYEKKDKNKTTMDRKICDYLIQNPEVWIFD